MDETQQLARSRMPRVDQVQRCRTRPGRTLAQVRHALRSSAPFWSGLAGFSVVILVASIGVLVIGGDAASARLGVAGTAIGIGGLLLAVLNLVRMLRGRG